MRKVFLLVLLFFFLAPSCLAQEIRTHVQTKIDVSTNVNIETTDIPSSGYVITDFQSKIEVNKDTTLAVTETIKTNFYRGKHGIFRIIPVIYLHKGKTIHARLKLISVTDENGNSYIKDVDPFGQSVKIKIGDPNKTISGLHTYVIKYNINKVLQRYKDHDEVYWNVTGHEWDTVIEKSEVSVLSSFAPIKNALCFAGAFGSQEKNCESNFSQNEASFLSNEPLGNNKDFTIVVALDKNNSLSFPGPLQQFFDLTLDNWGYIFALIPLFMMFLFWYKKGRDLAYISGNVYYQPEDKAITTVSLFAREHLPMVYSPINGLTPSEVGTIIDEKVDIQDVVAEIIELARLGFLQIIKVEKKGFLGSTNEFIFVKKDKDTTKLADYQKYLYEKIFSEVVKKEDLEKLLKNNLSSEVRSEIEKIIKDGDLLTKTTLLSDLKNKFYKHLDEFKKKLYADMKERKFFDEEPEKVKTKWTCLSIILIVLSFVFSIIFAALTENGGPFLISFLITIPMVIFARSMSRRTAWGHSLFRQITGLRYYINIGKWREEISEKHLFLEEILPLAISLGVVNKLASDMAALGVEPPSYFTGVAALTFASDFNNFNSFASSTLISSPVNYSGKSSWSGGSGFSGGGSSGGGFGGGGGGSW